MERESLFDRPTHYLDTQTTRQSLIEIPNARLQSKAIVLKLRTAEERVVSQSKESIYISKRLNALPESGSISSISLDF
jgi:hypothetical protein